MAPLTSERDQDRVSRDGLKRAVYAAALTIVPSVKVNQGDSRIRHDSPDLFNLGRTSSGSIVRLRPPDKGQKGQQTEATQDQAQELLLRGPVFGASSVDSRDISQLFDDDSEHVWSLVVKTYPRYVLCGRCQGSGSC